MSSYSWTVTVPAAPTTPSSAPVDYATDTRDLADFGYDILAFPSLDMTWTPRNDNVALADAVLRRLFTPRGRLWAYPSYGIDIRDYLNDEVTRDTLSALKADVEAQAEEDERVLAAEARVSFNMQTETLTVRLALESELGPFALVLGVTDVSTTILLEE